jgi:ribosomal-protein-alanine N-acetyltransferase
MQKFPTIKTNRLVLRKIRQADISAVFDMFSRDDVTEHYGCYPFEHKSQALDWVTHNISNYGGNGYKGFRWAITLAENTDALIGSCGIHSVNPHFKSLEIGYDLHPNYWGKGIATEAVSGLLAHCFNNDFPMQLNRVAATTDVVSPLSVSVLTKLRFKEEGTIREDGFWKDQFHDVRLFSLLRREWALNK